MIKPVKRNKARKFISAEDLYWSRVYKDLSKRSGKEFHAMERGGKIVWEVCEEIFFGRQMLAAYRKTDKYRCKPLMYQVVSTEDEQRIRVLGTHESHKLD